MSELYIPYNSSTYPFIDTIKLSISSNFSDLSINSFEFNGSPIYYE